jgi:2,4-dienoyl-CoA reductase-like NADH-dependent reductase (Old Yellow Enzyme family)
MSKMALTHVLTPIEIGHVEIKNRIFSLAHGTGFGPGVNNSRIECHASRAHSVTGPAIIDAPSSIHQEHIAGASV